MITRGMTSRTWIAAIVALTAIGTASSASAQGRQAGPATQGRGASPPDHWSLVPAFATSCFAEDDFSDKVDAARTAIEAEKEKQTRINVAAKEKYDNMDMGEKAQRMQAFMMKDPQAAMKMMQGEQTAGTSAQARITEASESSARLDAELERLQGAFRASSEQARKPVIARRDALIKAKTVLLGEAAIPAFTTAADHAQYVQLIAEENTAHERACAPYFGPDGSFHKWASSYRTEVVDKLAGGGAGDAVMIMQMQAMDLPGGNYKDTTPLQQTNEFLRRVRGIWAIRPNKTKPTVELKK